MKARLLRLFSHFASVRRLARHLVAIVAISPFFLPAFAQSSDLPMGTFLNDMAWSPQLSRFVAAVENPGAILTSPDGVTWSRAALPLQYDWPGGVAWNPENSLFAAVGGASIQGEPAGVILTSHDGFTWRRAYVWGGLLTDVTSFGPAFIVVGYDGIVFSSTDGLTWKTVRQGGWPNPHLIATAPSPTQLVAVGVDGTIISSSDGTVWLPRDSSTSEWLGPVLWNPARSEFIVLGNRGTILTSSDGITWSPRDPGTVLPMRSIASNGNLYVAGGRGIHTSTDGLAWTERVANTLLFSVVWNGKKFVAVGAAVMTSPDGINWTKHSYPLPHPADIDYDRRLSLAEVTNYASSWKFNSFWPSGPSPIPMSYVVRAGLLWRAGEAYTHDPAAGTEPITWIPAPAP